MQVRASPQGLALVLSGGAVPGWSGSGPRRLDGVAAQYCPSVIGMRERGRESPATGLGLLVRVAITDHWVEVP